MRVGAEVARTHMKEPFASLFNCFTALYYADDQLQIKERDPPFKHVSYLPGVHFLCKNSSGGEFGRPGTQFCGGFLFFFLPGLLGVF